MTGPTGIAGPLGGYTQQDVTWDSTVSIDCSTADVFDLTLSGPSTVFNITGGVNGRKFMVRFKQDNAGNRVISFGAMVRFGTDITGITLSNLGGLTDHVAFIYNGPAGKYDLIAYARGYS